DAGETGANGPDPGGFTVTRSGASLQIPLTVFLQTSGSATPGPDYARLPDYVLIPAGSSSATVTVSPVADSQVEGDETVNLSVRQDASYSMGMPSSATVTIHDTPPPTLTVVATKRYAGESGGQSGVELGTFTIT